MRIYTKTPYTESEKGIQTACMNRLKGLGWTVIRTNSGKIAVSGKTGTRHIMLQDPGTPDTLNYKLRPSGMVVWWIEYKVPGKKPTWLQEQKMIELKQSGARVSIIHSEEELIEQAKTIDK